MKFSTAILQALLSASLAQQAGASSVWSSTKATAGLRRHLKDDEEDKAPPTKRDCELKAKGDEKVEFECKTKTENEDTEMKDKIKFKVSHDNKGLKVKVEYEQETEMDNRRSLQDGTDIEEIETETSYEVVFGSLIEYEKPGASGRRRLSAVEQAYDWEADIVVKEMPLADWSGFSAVDVSRRRLQGGDEDTVYKFSLSTYDQVATFDFEIAQAGGANPAVTANKMKIDVRLRDYPWVSESSNLALLSNVESEREVKVEYADEKDQKEEEEKEKDDEEEEDEMKEEEEPQEAQEDHDEEGDDRRRRRLDARETDEVKISFDDALSMTGVQPFGEYTWAKTAQASTGGNSTLIDSNSTTISIKQYSLDEDFTNSVTIQVVATTPPDSNEQLAFSFVGSDAAKGASDIYWDPETGINYATGTAGSGALSLWSGSVALVMSAMVAFLL